MKKAKSFKGMLVAIFSMVVVSLCSAAVLTAINDDAAITAEAAGKTGVIKASDGNWYYYINGKKQTNYTGVANYKNKNGWWYIKKGKVDFSANTVAKNKNGWWYVTGGKVRFGFTGLANYKNANGWWYIKNGKVDFNAKGVYKNKNGWYYVKNGKVQFSYNGFASNSNGKWYIDKGKVTFKKTGVLKDSTGAIGKKNTWYYVKNSKVQTSYTGVASNSNGTWYIKNGKVDFSYSGTYATNGTVYTISGGKVTKTAACSHDWVQQYTEKQVWVEDSAGYSQYVCKYPGCGYTTRDGDSIALHNLDTGHTWTTQHVDATGHYETEKVANGYKCSICGATK